MQTCHWHPDRETTVRCEVCQRYMCESCATDVSETKQPYRLCPECLTAAEEVIERSLGRQGRAFPRWRVWVGAIVGASMPLAVWIAAMCVLDPTWFIPARWVGTVAIGFSAAMLAVRLGGGHRGIRATVAVLACVIPAVAFGYYISTSLLITALLTDNPDVVRQLADVGIVIGEGDWLLPYQAVAYVFRATTTWMDYTVIAASFYLAYALTHRRRLWKARFRWFT